jgi:serine/threonine protein kinase
LGFAAPELLLNRLSIVNQSTDIYALGILIWRLYTGELPLTHPNPSIFTNLQLTHPLPNDSSIPKRLFPILEKMTVKHQFQLPPNKMGRNEVDELLSKAMLQRYTNLTEVLNDIQEMISKRSFLPKKIFSKP